MFEDATYLETTWIKYDTIEELIEIICTYFTKSKMNYLDSSDAYELCYNYEHVQCLVNILFDLMVENNKNLRVSVDKLYKINSENKN